MLERRGGDELSGHCKRTVDKSVGVEKIRSTCTAREGAVLMVATAGDSVRKYGQAVIKACTLHVSLLRI